MRRVLLFLLAAVALSAPAWAQQGYIPDHERTPGAVNANITQDNIAQTVCVPGFTKAIRPPTSYTNRLKAQQMRELGLAGTPHDYHEDHLVPLCVGGASSDARNLLAGGGGRQMECLCEGSVGVQRLPAGVPG